MSKSTSHPSCADGRSEGQVPEVGHSRSSSKVKRPKRSYRKSSITPSRIVGYEMLLDTVVQARVSLAASQSGVCDRKVTISDHELEMIEENLRASMRKHG